MRLDLTTDTLEAIMIGTFLMKEMLYASILEITVRIVFLFKSVNINLNFA